MQNLYPLNGVKVDENLASVFSARDLRYGLSNGCSERHSFGV
jgi:hypothetical protein